jgi:type II secretory pathway pseudopilin PulG
MRSDRSGFTMVELAVVMSTAALLLSVLIPCASRARELSKKMVCARNLKNIGVACRAYASDEDPRWPIPGFKSSVIDGLGITYTNGDNGLVGYPTERTHESTRQSASGSGGSTRVSVTRALWMLVRSGDLNVTQFVCPTSWDEPDPTEVIDTYYDFLSYQNISYGYQVPFGPLTTQPRSGVDNHMVYAADKGPYYLQIHGFPDWEVGLNGLITLNDPPKLWRPFNSPNHGGRDNGEGQNCLFADGRVDWKEIPAVGMDNNNIYTLMANDWASDFGRIHGWTPFDAPTSGDPYPGQDAFCTGGGCHSSTDSLLYP